MASGDVVNTAARLQAAAPVNGVLVGRDDVSRDRAGDRLPRRPSRSRRRARREPVRRLGGRRGARALRRRRHRARRARRSSDASGARRARRRVRACAQGAHAAARHARRRPGHRQVAGSSTSCSSRSRPTPDLITWRQGRSLPYGEGVTFWALAEMVKAQAGILETDSAERGRGEARGRRPKRSSPSAARPAGSRRTSGRSSASAARATGGDGQAEAFAAWRRFLEALAERGPLVLVFEDLHWADDGLLDFVDHLVDWASEVPLLVVCTARPELLSRRPGWGGGKPNAAHALALAALGRRDGAARPRAARARRAPG